mgnify:FL=1
MTFADFRAWKISRARASIAKCRKARAEGRHSMADWHLYMAELARKSIYQ